jgi:peptidoglycan/LPS O-acetylase OafA/YrhL
MIRGLDGLRAIAFLLVFALHTEYLQVGWVGVSLFFVLSGFLITGILLDMKKELATLDYFLKFYGRRFLRIFPLYYVYLGLTALLTTWLISIHYRPRYMQIFLDQVWYALLYVYDFFFASTAVRDTNFLDHFWSLSVEEQFYIFWPLLLFLVPERSLKKLFLGFIVLGPLFRLVFFLIHASGVLRFLTADPAVAIYPMPFSHMDAFALGAYISQFSIPKAKQQFFFLAAFLPVFGFISLYVATGKLADISTFGYPFLLRDAYQFIWAYSLLDYFFAIIIYGVAYENWLTNVLEWQPLRYMGKISYGLYVYHFPVIWFATRLADLGIESPFLKPVTALLSLGVTVLIASLSFYYIEKPIMNLKDRFFPLASSGKWGTRIVPAKQTSSL